MSSMWNKNSSTDNKLQKLKGGGVIVQRGKDNKLLEIFMKKVGLKASLES